MDRSGNPTIRDVAKLAKVSIGTVSRVINGNQSVKPRLKLRIDQAMQELGYVPNAIAQSMRRQRTHLIGFIIPDISNSLFASMAKHAEELLQTSGYSLMLSNTNGLLSKELQLLQIYQQRQIDGLIIAISSENNTKLKTAMSELPFPIVVLDRISPVSVDMVMTDHASGIKLATEYLIDLGHRNIGLITAGEEISPGRERLNGFHNAFKSKGLKSNPNLIRCGSLTAAYGFQEASSLLRMPDRPTALIAGGNQLLEGVLKVINQIGINIPNDLSLISCDDTALTELTNPAITVVNRDLKDIGTTAARFLLKRLEDPDNQSSDPQTVIFPTNLILRHSCIRLH